MPPRISPENESLPLAGPAAPSKLASIWLRHRNPLILLLITIVLLLSFAALHRLNREIHFSDVRAAFSAIGSIHVAMALILTALSYFLLTGYDMLALRVIGHPLPWRTAALASFTAYALSNNLGASYLTGGSARLRVYTRAGMEPADVARVILLTGLAFWGGTFLVVGIALLIHSGPLQLGRFDFPPWLQQGAGALLIVLIAGAIIAGGSGNRRICLVGWSLPVPPAPMASAQIIIAALDLAAASGALFILVPGISPEAFAQFYLAYALAVTAAMISHVPGGIGVFEAVLLAALPGEKAMLLAAVVTYRVIYYLIPLTAALLLLIASEGRSERKPVARALVSAKGLASAIAPAALSALVLSGGVILLVSGALPGFSGRLALLQRAIPLPFIEASHMAASLVGTALLLLAPGLYRRLDGAALLTIILLVAGAGFSLMKGLDYEEALLLLAVAGLIYWLRPAFYRRTRLTSEPITGGWLIAAALALVASVWIGLSAYRYVEYRDSLWWQFTLYGDASRFIRASLAASVLLTAFAIRHLLGRPDQAPAGNSLPEDVRRQAFQASDRTDANLALIGDKNFILSPSGDAFLMYGVKGRTWIVMGDPVGPPDTWADLFWMVRAVADRTSGRLLLYQISPRGLGLAIELGLNVMKYGEEALVDLTRFNLASPQLRHVRRGSRRAAKDGASFQLVPAPEVAGILPQLRDLSDEWLAAKGQKEKSFSVGAFVEEYLRHFDCAIIMHRDRIVAFANVWTMPNKNELSIDLMRHRTDAPAGTMDLLFAELMHWGREQGYRRFSLGLAPLSGIDARALAPRWAKLMAFLYRHGERLYGFRGLRAYKEKFDPVWEPRYVAGPPGLGLLPALVDLLRLIERGPDAPSRTKAIQGDNQQQSPTRSTRA